MGDVPEYQMQGDGMTFTRLEATENVEWYSSMLALHYTKSGMKEQTVSAFSGERAVLLSENCMEQMGTSVGDRITLTNGTD